MTNALPFTAAPDERLWFDVFVGFWIAEDYRHGDPTSEAVFPPDHWSKARIVAREGGLACGIAVVLHVWRRYVGEGEVTCRLGDGDRFDAGAELLTLDGPTRWLLALERPFLNMLQHLSAIATRAAQWQARVAPYGTRLLATRKTTPGLRWLEKWAVEVGGAAPPRRDLADELMIKDTHADAAGGLDRAVEKAIAFLDARRLRKPLVVEVRHPDDIERIRRWWPRIDRLLLDNFSPSEVADALRRYPSAPSFEASGGITEGNLEAYARTGVPYISSSALHRPCRPLDLSMQILSG